MASINILHASDLHICVHNQLRSPLDRLHDLKDFWDLSVDGINQKLLLLPEFAEAWWKKMAVSSYDQETLEALAEFIYNNAKRKQDGQGNQIIESGAAKLDAVVLTGDLATTGSSDDIELVAKFLRAPASYKCPWKNAERHHFKPTLSGVKIPIVCLPGNHDRFIDLGNFKPGSEEFDEQVFDYRPKRWQELELTAPLAQGKTLRVILMAVDFTLEQFFDCKGEFGWLAQGRAYSDRRKKLAERTDKLKETSGDDEVLCIIWAMHFPPMFPHYPEHSRLLGEEKLVQAANKLGVRAILAGHTHVQSTYRTPDMGFWVYCCGTTTQYEPLAMTQKDGERGNFFQIITITGDASGQINISGKDYRYGETGTSFTPLMGWLPCA